MKIPSIHPFDLTIEKAKKLQVELSPKVQIKKVRQSFKLIAGVDAAYEKAEKLVFAAVVIWDLDTKKVIEESTAVREGVFPYIPGFLSFREIPVVLEAFKKIRNLPDAILCDGQGIAHPRRFGLASHLGFLLQIPTVGCAKSRLIGDYQPPLPKKGAWSWLTFGDSKKKIGTVLTTRDHVKPLFVSPGHLVSFEQARTLVLACTTRYRLPEPTRLAHLCVSHFSRLKTIQH